MDRKIKEYFEEKYHEETFAQMLFRLIDELGFTDTEVYKNAYVDRKLFSKIRCDKDYKPSKKTVICLVLSLKLDNKMSKKLIKKAGYILTGSSKFDLSIRYCIENQIYDLVKVNEIVYEMSGQTLLD